MPEEKVVVVKGEPQNKGEEKPKVGEETASLQKMAGTYQITIKIGDKEWTCTSPVLGDHARFYGRLRAKKVDEAEKYLKMLLRAGVSEQLAVDKFDTMVRTIQPNEIEVFEATNSLEGARYYFYASAHRNHRELTEKDVEALVTLSNWEDVIQKLNTLSPPPEISKNVLGGKMVV